MGCPTSSAVASSPTAARFSSLTYIVGDVLAEVYGLRQAKRAIWVGFALGALASSPSLAVGAAPLGRI